MKRRLLILGCSATKRPDPGTLPAIERYDGPAYRVVRKHLAELPAGSLLGLRILVLSAKYGLIGGWDWIANYDEKLTRSRALELSTRELGLDVLAALNAVEGGWMYGGALYRQVVTGACAQAGVMLSPYGLLGWTAGGIGEQLAGLKGWLQRTAPTPAERRALIEAELFAMSCQRLPDEIRMAQYRNELRALKGDA